MCASSMEMMRELQASEGGAGGGARAASAAGTAPDAEVADIVSISFPPDLPPYSGDYIISDYMERLGTRLNILEAELKYAWRALDLLSQEYIRMWERLERLETLLADQQGVISSLLDFYTCRTGSSSREPLSRLEVIREILGNGTVEDGIEEGLDAVGIGRNIVDLEENAPELNEAFYQSLNRAYRDDLVCEEVSRPSSQLDMIWEISEDEVINKNSRQMFDNLEYKDFYDDSLPSSNRNLNQISQLDAVDQMTVEKLQELDRISIKLQNDSKELHNLQNTLLSPERVQNSRHGKEIETSTLMEDGNIINEQLRQLYGGSENWGLDAIKNFDDTMFLESAETSSINQLENQSRYNVIDNNISSEKERSNDINTLTSPRRKYFSDKTSTEPYTTVTGRLAYSSAVANAEINAAKLSKSPGALSRERFDFSYPVNNSSEYNIFVNDYSTSNIASEKSGLKMNLTGTSNENYSDTYKNSTDNKQIKYNNQRLFQSPSPPPPAPLEGNTAKDKIDFKTTPKKSTTLLDTGSPLPVYDQSRLSPRSPRSPRTSPKSVKRDQVNNIVTAKSDSGLSSMSGWSSLEKSPGSPKIIKMSNDHNRVRTNSPQNSSRISSYPDYKSYVETLVDSYICPNTNDSQQNFDKDFYEKIEQFNTFQPDGRLVVSQCMSPYINYKHTDQASIYAIAGNSEQNYSTVYKPTNEIQSLSKSPIDFEINTSKDDFTKLNDSQTIYDYPPEPSYHAQTSVLTTTTTSAPSNRKNISRAMSIGTVSIEENSIYNNYKPTAHKNIYPPSNITDALSYYPTSTRYETSAPYLGDVDYTHTDWSESNNVTRLSNSRGANQHFLNNQKSLQYQNQLQQEYYRHQFYDQNLDDNNLYQNTLVEENFENIDFKNYSKTQNIRSISNDQYLKNNNILVSQSGYLMISSSLKEKPLEKQTKKPKRTGSLKSAMNSMSNWLPEIHLPKKHRSYSLPSGVDSVNDPVKSEKSLKEKILSAQRRKKKYQIVASVSGLLHKARRKVQSSQQSLSDPEASETEWSGGRSSVQSEDSDSVFSDTTNDFNLFPKVLANIKQQMQNNHDDLEVEQTNQILNVTSEPANQTERKNVDIERDQSNLEFKILNDNINSHFNQKQINSTDQIPNLQKLDIDTDISESGPYEEEKNENSDLQSLTSMFATIGDVKRAAAAPEDVTDNIQYNNSGPMEFTVSRAVGKYRLRKSSSVSEDQISDSTQEDSVKNLGKKNNGSHVTTKDVVSNRKTSPPEIIGLGPEEHKVVDNISSMQNIRSHGNKFMPRHQQSLDIPRHDDEDNRSTHSWRSGSRVSSRRQSTEDSIDSEDEWYCYELRKLEEMERQSQLEAEREKTVIVESEEDIPFSKPNKEVKEKMTFVLRELKLKTSMADNTGNENVKRKNDSQNVSLTSQKSAIEAFARITDYHSWHDSTQDEESFVEKIDIEEEKQDTVRSDSRHSESGQSTGSGETSGPDSPVQSGDELDDGEFEDNLEEEKEPHSSPQPPASSATDGPIGSKWKLLKALKDRKAEEKSVETPTTTTVNEKEKVSTGVSYIMQKIYEIRVKS